VTLNRATIQQSFGFAGAVAAERKERGISLTYFADVDEREVLRRAEVGMGAIVDRRVINALWEVPSDMDLPRDSLPSWVLERLMDAAGADVGLTVRRHVRPPITVRGAAAVGPTLRSLLDALGPLSSVCPTAAVLTTEEPEPTHPARLDAGLFGVAVGVAEGDGIRVLSEPAAVRGDLGPYQWHLAEVVYSELRSAR
jgi:hypothetical protein